MCSSTMVDIRPSFAKSIAILVDQDAYSTISEHNGLVKSALAENLTRSHNSKIHKEKFNKAYENIARHARSMSDEIASPGDQLNTSEFKWRDASHAHTEPDAKSEGDMATGCFSSSSLLYPEPLADYYILNAQSKNDITIPDLRTLLEVFPSVVCCPSLSSTLQYLSKGGTKDVEGVYLFVTDQYMAGRSSKDFVSNLPTPPPSSNLPHFINSFQEQIQAYMHEKPRIEIFALGPSSASLSHIMDALKTGAADYLFRPLTAASLQHVPERLNNLKGANTSDKKNTEWETLQLHLQYTSQPENDLSDLIWDLSRKSFKNTQLSTRLSNSMEHSQRLSRFVQSWDFQALSLTDYELIECLILVMEHVLSDSRLSRFRISTENLADFILAIYCSYFESNPYHNFRHAVDVFQVTSYFLFKIGVIPPIEERVTSDGAAYNVSLSPSENKFNKLFPPIGILALLVSSLGHDAGHPGVNNAFLVNTKSSLADMYNNLSVLENFHSQVLNAILQEHWPSCLEVDFQNILKPIVLATDMGLHFKIMEDIKALDHGAINYDNIKDEDLRKLQALIYAAMIKGADISNVARPFHTSSLWSENLVHETAHQSRLEERLGVNGNAPPKSWAAGQLGFMKLFAIPLFNSLVQFLPPLQFTLDFMEINTKKWLEFDKGNQSQAE